MENEQPDVAAAIASRMLWAANNIPGFVIIDKARSPLMKVLFYVSGMFLWNRRFMTDFTTTIGARMYTTQPIRGVNGLALLNHELVHMQDARRLTRPVFFAAYLFPQVLALGAFGAFWNRWWLLALLALLPWPAPFRVWAERRGYAATFHTLLVWEAPLRIADVLKHMHKVFCGPSYYWMAWRWEPLRAFFWDKLVNRR